MIPFRVLDAPKFRDDFYCSLLAYSERARCLAVGLGTDIYLWSEDKESNIPSSMNTSYDSYVTCLAFNNSDSSETLLASGRSCGRLLLWGLGEATPRFDRTEPSQITCLAFRPQMFKTQSKRDPHIEVSVEHLLIGNEAGHVYLYALEWPKENHVAMFDWKGDLTLIARVTAHTQQICGLAWSPDVRFFASGANDNVCYLFETSKILELAKNSAAADLNSQSLTERREPSSGTTRRSTDLFIASTFHLPPCAARHKFSLNAAVKAIAFCP